MSAQDERERALILAAWLVYEDDEIGAERNIAKALAIVDAKHPRPATDAAVRAEIVAELRARATSEREGADKLRASSSSLESPVMRLVATAQYASRVLRELADRIEAAHPRPASDAVVQDPVGSARCPLCGVDRPHYHPSAYPVCVECGGRGYRYGPPSGDSDGPCYACRGTGRGPDDPDRSMLFAHGESPTVTDRRRALASAPNAAHPQAEPARYTREEVLAFGAACVSASAREVGLGFGAHAAEAARRVNLRALLDATVKR